MMVRLEILSDGQMSFTSGSKGTLYHNVLEPANSCAANLMHSCSRLADSSRGYVGLVVRTRSVLGYNSGTCPARARAFGNRTQITSHTFRIPTSLSGRFKDLSGSETPDSRKCVLLLVRLAQLDCDFEMLACASCLPGHFGDGVGLTTCYQCTAGVNTRTEQQTACESCLIGALKDYEMLEGAFGQPGFFRPSPPQTPLDSIPLVEPTSVIRDLTTACVSTLGVFPSPPQ